MQEPETVEDLEAMKREAVMGLLGIESFGRALIDAIGAYKQTLDNDDLRNQLEALRQVIEGSSLSEVRLVQGRKLRRGDTEITGKIAFGEPVPDNGRWVKQITVKVGMTI